MKKPFLILTLVLLVSSVGFARRMDTPVSTSGVGVMKHGSTFTLFYKALKPSNVKVSIFDASGKLVFTETIRKSEGFARPYNFSSLQEGEYTIRVVDCERSQTETVLYKQESDKSLINVARVSGTTNKYLLTVPSKTKGVVYVRIYDDKNQILYDQKESIHGDFARIYNLENVNGKLLFSVSDSKGNTTKKDY